MKKTIQVILGFVWLAVIGYYFYFENHPYYAGSFDFIGRIIAVILVFSVLMSAMIGAQALWNKHKKRPLLELKMTVWKALVALFLLVAGIFMVGQLNADLAVYHGGTIFQDELGWGMMPEGYPLEEGMVAQVSDGTIISSSTEFINLMPATLREGFTQVNLFQGLAFTFWQLLKVLGFLSLLTLAAYSVGRKIAKKNFLMSMAIGLGVYMAVMFLLGLFGLLNPWIVAGIAAVITGVCWKQAYELLKNTVTGSIKTKIDLKSLSFWVFMGAILILVHNVIEIIRPLPIGWDDVNYYAYIPERVAGLGELIKGSGGMYNWELIDTIGAFADTGMYILFTNFFGGVLAFTALYLLMKEFLSGKTALMMSSFFVILPAVFFQQSLDIKNDLALLFYLLMAMYAFVQWWRKDKASWLYFAGIFVGIAIGIKSLGGVLLLVLLILMAQKIFKKEGGIAMALIILGALFATLGMGNLYHIAPNIMFVLGIVTFIGGALAGIFSLKNLKKPNLLKHAGIFLVIVGLLITPWVIKNAVIDGMPINAASYIASNPNGIGIDSGQYLEECGTPALGDELTQYISGTGDKASEVSWVSLLKMPWQMTMNPGVDGVYTDISIVFLGLLPLFLWYLAEKKDRSYRLGFAMAAFYIFVTAFFLNGIIWYGFAGLCILLILIGKMIEAYDKESWHDDKMLGMVIKSAIAITVIMTVFVRIASWGGVEDLAYWGGIIDEDEYIEAVAPGTVETIQYLENAEDFEGTHLYVIGGVLGYFMAGLDNKLYGDDTLANFICFDELYDPEGVSERFKELGINYIAVDYTIFIEKQENIDPELVDRYIKFLDFGIANWETPVYRPDYILFRIP